MSGLGRLHRRVMQYLLVEGEPPERRAGAFALGVFLSFSPLLGLQVVIGMAAAQLLRLSRALVFVGLCVNLPWITVPYYVAVTEVAARAFGWPSPSHMAAGLSAVMSHSVMSGVFWRELTTLLRPLLWPFALGSTVSAVVLAAVTYGLALRVVRAAERRQAEGKEALEND